jgi:hypothetical protein
MVDLTRRPALVIAGVLVTVALVSIVYRAGYIPSQYTLVVVGLNSLLPVGALYAFVTPVRRTLPTHWSAPLKQVAIDLFVYIGALAGIGYSVWCMRSGVYSTLARDDIATVALFFTLVTVLYVLMDGAPLIRARLRALRER